MRSYKGPGTIWRDDHHTGDLVAHEQIDDGKWHHRFGASWIKTVDLCAERARLEAYHEIPDVRSDAAEVGHSVHAVIETNLDLWVDGEALSLSDSVELFHDDFSQRMLEPLFEWKKYKEASARAFGEKCVTAWYRDVLFTLPQEGSNEHKFVLPFVEDDERVIELSGAIDRVDTILRDWKTNGSRAYQEWEYKRWNVQATTYTWAACQLGLVKRTTDIDNFPQPVPLEFVVLMGDKVHRFPVMRDERDWDFLRDKCIAIAKQIEADLPQWMLNDNHALCSPKWCPAWDLCKGKNGLEF